MSYNLDSPNDLLKPVDPDATKDWYEHELQQVNADSVREILRVAMNHIDDFVHWPKRAELLWANCDRLVPDGHRQRYHSYPESIRERAKAYKVRLDSRANGPAIAAFQLAGGSRPDRFGSSNAWSIHHVYSGKYPYIGRSSTTHAVKEGHHFTQSAGLIAIHPIAYALSDEFPFFSWLLRYESFRRFGYDPDGVFSAYQDSLGFATANDRQAFDAGPSSNVGWN